MTTPNKAWSRRARVWRNFMVLRGSGYGSLRPLLTPAVVRKPEGEEVLQIFAIDESGERFEITDLYWFEEQGVHDFGGEGLHGEKI